MARRMTNLQRSKLNWEGMLRWCSRSAHSDGTPPPHHRPAHWEGMLKWRGEAQQQQQQPKKHWMVTVKEVSEEEEEEEEEEEGLDALEPPNKLTQIDHDQQQLTTDVTSLQNTIHVLNNSVQHLTEQVKTMFQQLQTVLPVAPHHRQAQPSGGLLIQDDSPAHDSDSDSDGILQDGRPAYSPPSPPPAAAYHSDRSAYDPPPINANDKYVAMGWLRPWSLNEAMRKFISSGGILDDCPALSDGTPAPRWWEIEYKKPWRLPSGIQDDRPAPQLSMVGSISNWEGRLKRSKLRRTFRPNSNYSVQDVVAQRVCEIAEFFKVPEDPDDITIETFGTEQFEYWLDEVQGYFEFMDLAHELHSIDCLFPLLHHVLVYPHAASIRAKAAELVTAMVHNNPRSQHLVMKFLGLRPLWYNFTSDPDVTSRTKALGAISALIRNNKYGITAFRNTCGYCARLGDALSSENVRFQREALNLFQYLLHENCSDESITELGLPSMMMHRASSDDAEARVAALRGLLVLAKDEEGTFKKEKKNQDGSIGQLVKNDVKLKQVLQELIKRIIAMAPEDLVAAREEIQLVDSLWNACYNEPSSLKLFEPCSSSFLDAN